MSGKKCWSINHSHNDVIVVDDKDATVPGSLAQYLRRLMIFGSGLRVGLPKEWNGIPQHRVGIGWKNVVL